MPPRTLAVAVAVTLVAALAACAPTSPPAGRPAASTPSPLATAASSPTPPIATTTPSPSASPTPTSPPTPVSPLTGMPAPAGPRPVLIVKLDNTANAQPHAGLAKADVVYLEEVEYGITRIAAVFSSAVPRRIGPVRSARITDVDLVAEYGKPAFAYSGAQRRMWPVLDKASIHDVSPNHAASAYRRDYARRAPYNLFVDGRAVLASAPRASASKDIGFVFDPMPPAGGRTATKATMKWSYASAGFGYDEQTGRYRVYLNGDRAKAEGAPGGQNASTVVIQYVKQEPSRYFDKGGGNTPLAHTIGSGRGIVLRDGLAWQVRWQRADERAGTTFTLEDGSPMPFKPGQTWVVLRDRTKKATITPLTVPATATPAASPSVVPTPTPG